MNAKVFQVHIYYVLMEIFKGAQISYRTPKSINSINKNLRVLLRLNEISEKKCRSLSHTT